MGATLPKIKSPLKCIPENWDQFAKQSLKKKRNNPQLSKACTPYLTNPSLGLPVAPPSTNAD
ncbi:hypothetical protein AAY473_015449 [Plecturocebus cupreus]